MTPAKFRALRESLGLTQTEWGDWLGVHRVNVSKIESGKKPISPTLSRLLDAIAAGYRPKP
jgi:DNA-binding transcriptional regulator YiaG